MLSVFVVVCFVIFFHFCLVSTRQKILGFEMKTVNSQSLPALQE